MREDFRASGLAHLLAASGTNVALLAALVLAVATAAGLGLTGRLVLALVAIAAYVPLAGGGPSIQRAGVMGAAALLAVLAGRPASRWYALLLAAAATLALNPRAVGDVGWQLSFAAVVALLAAGPSAARAGCAACCPARSPRRSALTIAATLGTAPLVALHFGTVSVVSLGANLLAAPVVAPVMWLGAIAAVLGQALPRDRGAPRRRSPGRCSATSGGSREAAARMPGAEASLLARAARRRRRLRGDGRDRGSPCGARAARPPARHARALGGGGARSPARRRRAARASSAPAARRRRTASS